MKAIRIDRSGGPEAMRYEDVEPPAIESGELLIRHEAIGVNYIDVYYRNGTYAAPHRPFTPGMEAAGIVKAAGSGVRGIRPGDRVAYAQTLGSYAEYAAVPAARTVLVPEGVGARDAAALMLQGMTAHYLSHATFVLANGHYALVHAGAGGVGLLLTQMAKRLGATVVTTVSTEEKARLSTEAGADLVIDYTREDFVDLSYRYSCGDGMHVVYDSVGETTFDRSLDALRPRGTLVLYGASSGPVPPFDLQVLNRKGSLYLTRPTLAHYAATTHDLRERAGACFAMVAAGALDVRIGQEYPLAEAARAHADLEARATTGKILLIP